MIHERDTQVLRRLLEASTKQAIHWQKDDGNDWYSAKLGKGVVSLRFLYVEATNQAGADRQFTQISMPGFNRFFASGTEGFNLILEILSVAFESWRKATEGHSQYALNLLDEVISRAETSSGDNL